MPSLEPEPETADGPAGAIVVGVDGAEGGWEALALAQRLARCDRAPLVVVCAYPVIAAQHAVLVWPRIASESDARDVLGTARSRLAANLGVTFVSAPGTTPGTVLQDVASERDAALIAVGSSRRALPGRVLGGDVVKQVLDEPPCPVAVAPRELLDAESPFRDIGIAVDGTPEALAAVRWARALSVDPFCARTFELVSVDGTVSASSAGGHGPMDHAHDKHRFEVSAALQLVARLDAPAQVVWTDAPGPVAPALAELSERLDLLVLGTHGRGPLGRLLHGGVAADVAGAARCAVVAVPCEPLAAATRPRDQRS